MRAQFLHQSSKAAHPHPSGERGRRNEFCGYDIEASGSWFTEGTENLQLQLFRKIANDTEAIVAKNDDHD